jgi:SAM-dependent methyltransferase
MELRELQKNWHEFGRSDPLWAILTLPEKRNGKWQLHDFFRTGEQEIADLLDDVRKLGLPLRHGRALDFGCGVGRLTQALCAHFEHCWGVDIAPSMIRLANTYNRHGPWCCYFLNETDNLGVFPDNHFDFIYTTIVLQHMEPRYSRKYIEEFLRVLARGGVLVFQIPSARIQSEPMAEQAYRARIRPEQATLCAGSGAAVTISVHVKNVSEVVWPIVYLGNHWLKADGSMLINDDGRAVLAPAVKPQQEVALKLTVKTPEQAGEYLLELDVVQEGVAWFKDKGSPTTIVPTQIRPAERPLIRLGRLLTRRIARAVGALRSGPSMEMYGIPRDEVLSLLGRLGGKVIDVKKHDFLEWASYSYWVVK